MLDRFIKCIKNNDWNGALTLQNQTKRDLVNDLGSAGWNSLHYASNNGNVGIMR
jgi:hypothetical protein